MKNCNFEVNPCLKITIRVNQLFACYKKKNVILRKGEEKLLSQILSLLVYPVDESVLFFRFQCNASEGWA